ncbi:MAG: histidine kinase dimerization/phospho-acceptor domain-containing protein [Candidatus Zixiibacteriota bacterium]
MSDRGDDRFDILRQLAVAASRGDDLSRVSQQALSQTAAYVGLTAASLYMWNEEFEVAVNITHADTETARRRLEALEQDLFTSLRKEKSLVSAYLSFDSDPPSHSFTLPLRHSGRIFGAVIGFQEGERTIIAQDAFLEALSALMALNYAAAGAGEGTQLSRDALDKERLSAIIETAVTVNHEVNNPLTAILGNVQLLLLKRTNLDPELAAKLKTIEASALKIKDVTQRLMRLTSPKSVDYAEGTKMLDLSSDEGTTEKS